VSVDHGIAVDIGGTKILVAHARRPEQPLCVATRHDVGPERIVDQIVEAVESLWRPGVRGPLVVASPGDLDTRSGVVRYAANLPFRTFDLAGALSRRLGSPATLIGDATAATVAEFSGGGAGAGCRHGAYVTVSTGVGMGIVVGDRLVAGQGDQAGELGHVPVRLPDGVPCRCGQRGCLEAYASGRGMADRARDACEQHRGGRLERYAPEAITAREVIEAWRAGDGPAGRIVEDAIDLLGRAVAATVRLLAPSVVVLGGGVLLAGGLLDAVRDRAAEVLRPNDAGLRGRLRPARYGELSALVGAAALCRGDAQALTLLRPDAEPVSV
jgi:glucokinase